MLILIRVSLNGLQHLLLVLLLHKPDFIVNMLAQWEIGPMLCSTEATIPCCSLSLIPPIDSGGSRLIATVPINST
jgi:hypothetical protein